MENQQKYLVAIRCITYNHEKYLADALEGFVMQKTNFPFVAIVHDDASTDGTAAILRQYAEKYPDIIHPIYETENQYSKRDGSLGRIMNEAIAATGAKYVAMCEGDDYWTDPYKLQKQVDFMEGHEDYIVCFHRCRVLDQSTGTFHKEWVRDIQGESTISDIAVGNYIHTLSVIYRNIPQVIEDRKMLPSTLPVGDYVLWLLLAQYGKIWKMKDEMGVYREGIGVWSSKKCSYVQPRWVEMLHYLINFFNGRNKDVSANLMQQMKETVEIPMIDFEVQVAKLGKDLSNIQKSRAYRLGKAILRPFSWIKRKLK